MESDPVELDEHRGMAAQKATDIRRLRAEVEAQQAALRQRQAELEEHFLTRPAATWEEAAEKARYLIMLLADMPEGRDPRRQKIIAGVLDDFARLSDRPSRRRPAPTNRTRATSRRPSGPEAHFSAAILGPDSDLSVPQSGTGAARAPGGPGGRMPKKGFAQAHG